VGIGEAARAVLLAGEHAQFTASEGVEGAREDEQDYYDDHEGPVVVEDMVVWWG
jgi:hypothetical protein